LALKLPIYLDHHATTPVDPRVVDAMAPYWSDDFGNPSSAGHVFGWRAEEAVAIARERLASAIGASDPSEIVFTSGTTESDNLALIGLARAQRGGRDHLIASAIEHPAVLDACRFLTGEGFSLTILPVDGAGLVDPAAVEAAMTDRTLAVSVMAANGEIGTLQPIEEIGRICRAREVLFHTDAAQAVGKIPVDVQRWGVDLLSMCAHKLYGPKGIGALYIRKRRPRIALQPLLHGGGQEAGVRSGTLPVPLIVGFARAVELCLADLEAEAARLTALRRLARAPAARQPERLVCGRERRAAARRAVRRGPFDRLGVCVRQRRAEPRARGSRPLGGGCAVLAALRNRTLQRRRRDRVGGGAVGGGGRCAPRIAALWGLSDPQLRSPQDWQSRYPSRRSGRRQI
jgi:cysteine desulfurase